MGTEESELSDSSSEMADPPETLDGPIDENASPHSEGQMPSAGATKKASKKKSKSKKRIEDVASLEKL